MLRFDTHWFHDKQFLFGNNVQRKTWRNFQPGKFSLSIYLFYIRVSFFISLSIVLLPLFPASSSFHSERKKMIDGFPCSCPHGRRLVRGEAVLQKEEGRNCIGLHRKNWYQETCCSIMSVSAELRATISELHVGDQDRIEQGSSQLTSPSGTVSARSCKKGTPCGRKITRTWTFYSKKMMSGLMSGLSVSLLCTFLATVASITCRKICLLRCFRLTEFLNLFPSFFQ